MRNYVIQFLMFLATVGVLFLLFAWRGPEMFGNWTIPIALAIASVPSLILWLLKRFAGIDISARPPRM